MISLTGVLSSGGSSVRGWTSAFRSSFGVEKLTPRSRERWIESVPSTTRPRMKNGAESAPMVSGPVSGEGGLLRSVSVFMAILHPGFMSAWP